MPEQPTSHDDRRARRVRVGLITTAAVTAYAVFCYTALRPLHEHGVLQSPLAFLQGFDHLLHIPGLALAQYLGVRTGHHTTFVAWLLAVAVDACVYFLIGYGVVGRRQPSRRGTSSSSSPEMVPAAAPAERLRARRGFLVHGSSLLGAGVAAGLGYAFLLEPRWFGVTRREIRIRGLPAALDGLRVVQLTDIHHGPWLSLGYVREVIDTANTLQPDLVCLTGDYVHHSPAYIEPVVAELARLRPRIGTIGVLGNHDWWEDAVRMREEFEEAGIPLLDNGRLVLTPDRRLVRAAPEGLAVCGVGDLWQDVPDYRLALGGLPAAMPRLLLSHNPDAAEAPGLVSGGRRVDLMLCGHTHGGQIALPGLGTPVTNSRYGQKYAQGLIEGPVCPVFVSRGIGVSALPLRLGVPPEIAVLELRSAPA